MVAWLSPADRTFLSSHLFFFHGNLVSFCACTDLLATQCVLLLLLLLEALLKVCGSSSSLRFQRSNIKLLQLRCKIPCKECVCLRVYGSHLFFFSWAECNLFVTFYYYRTMCIANVFMNACPCLGNGTVHIDVDES